MFPHLNTGRSNTSVSDAMIRVLVDELPDDYNSASKIKDLPHILENEYSDLEFRSFLRLTRHGFDKFVDHVQQHINLNVHGKCQTNVRKQCMIFLKYLGSQDTLRDIAILFGLSESTVHCIIRRILNAIIPSLSSTLIKWPNEDAARLIAQQFATVSGFPAQVLGAIDCRENPIHPPVDNPNSY